MKCKFCGQRNHTSEHCPFYRPNDKPNHNITLTHEQFMYISDLLSNRGVELDTTTIPVFKAKVRQYNTVAQEWVESYTKESEFIVSLIANHFTGN